MLLRLGWQYFAPIEKQGSPASSQAVALAGLLKKDCFWYDRSHQLVENKGPYPSSFRQNELVFATK
jgi:hypothetical protein